MGRVPILIGGSGEKKTLRMVAQYADESNLTCGPDEVPRKLEALDAHCARLERDRSEITVSLQTQVCVALGHDEADQAMRAFLQRRGMDLDTMDDETRSMILAMITMGDPDEVGEQLQARLDTGVDGLTMNLVANGHHPENVELLGQVASRVLG